MKTNLRSNIMMKKIIKASISFLPNLLLNYLQHLNNYSLLAWQRKINQTLALKSNLWQNKSASASASASAATSSKVSNSNEQHLQFLFCWMNSSWNCCHCFLDWWWTGQNKTVECMVCHLLWTACPLKITDSMASQGWSSTADIYRWNRACILTHRSTDNTKMENPPIMSWQTSYPAWMDENFMMKMSQQNELINSISMVVVSVVVVGKL